MADIFHANSINCALVESFLAANEVFSLEEKLWMLRV